MSRREPFWMTKAALLFSCKKWFGKRKLDDKYRAMEYIMGMNGKSVGLKFIELDNVSLYMEAVV
jgi:hypothetical protein